MKKIDGQQEAEKHGFISSVPVLLMQDSRLSPQARFLMAYLLRYVNMKSGEVRPAQLGLARELGVHVRTIQRWLQELIELGYATVKVAAKKPGEANVYELSLRPCLEVREYDTDGVGDTDDVQGYDADVVHEYDADVVPECKPLESKSKNTGDAVAGSGNGQETNDPTLPAAHTDESTPQQIGTQDSMPNDADPSSSGRIGNDSPADPFDGLVKRIHIPASLRDHYGAIYAALRQCFTGQDGLKLERAIQRALTEVSLLVESDNVDQRGPAGLIVTKAKSYAEMPDRDFRADDVRQKYKRAMAPIPDEKMAEIRRTTEYSFAHAEGAFSRQITPNGETAVMALDRMVPDLVLWFALEQHGFKESRDRFESAALEWTFLNPGLQGIYREHYADVDVSKLNEFRCLWLEQHGIDISDEEGTEPT